MEECEKRKVSIRKTLMYISLLVFGFSLFAYLDFKNTGILYDDVYSVFMAKASYTDIVNITASDVHPPLYYCALKFFTSLFGDSLFIFRLFSALGVLAVCLLGCFPIRRLFGDRVAVFFLSLVILFPVTQYLVADIRMYSWTMFFVLSCALSAYQVFERGTLPYWILFFITGLCAAYLHNYGLLSVLGIYFLLFGFLIQTKKKLLYLILCGILFSAAYLPWLIQLWGQVHDVSSGYWIKPLTLNDLFLHIYYFYSPKEIWLPFTDFSKIQMIIGLVILMATQLFLTIKVLRSDSIKENKFLLLAILSFIAFLIPVAIGLLVSVTYLPILVTRYMTCSFGLFILSIAFILARAMELPRCRLLPFVFIFLLPMASGIRFYSGVNYYNQTESAYQHIQNFVRNGKSEAAVLVVNDFSYHVMPRLQVIAPDNEYIVLLTDGNKDDFRPFSFEERSIDNFLSDEFILVHQDREAVQNDFRQYQQSLVNRYVVIDSLHATDIHLYRMKRVIP